MLGMTGGLEALHAALALSRGAVRVIFEPLSSASRRLPFGEGHTTRRRYHGLTRAGAGLEKYLCFSYSPFRRGGRDLLPYHDTP
jgi:hypothetical protein